MPSAGYVKLNIIYANFCLYFYYILIKILKASANKKNLRMPKRSRRAPLPGTYPQDVRFFQERAVPPGGSRQTRLAGRAGTALPAKNTLCGDLPAAEPEPGGAI